MKRILLLISVVWLTASTALAQPQIDPTTVHVVASPNVMGWPVTTRIASLEAVPEGMRVVFDRCHAWPAVTPPGWDGPLIYTLWLFMRIGGEWYGSGIIQFWDCDQQHNGGPIYLDNQIARNWVYDNRWSSMVGHQPTPGERIGFMVSAGNARGQDDHQLAERSPIVEVAMPSGPGLLPFLAVEGTPPNPPPPPVIAPPVVLPPLIVTPSPAPPVVPAPPVIDVAAILAKLDELKTEIEAGRAENRTFYEHVGMQWKSVMAFLGKYVAPAVAGVIGGMKLSGK